MKKLIYAIRERIAKFLVDGMKKSWEEDDYSAEAQEPGAGAVIIGVLVNITVVYVAPPLWQLIGLMYPALGLIWFHYQLMKDAHQYNSTKWTEFLIAIQVDSNVFCALYFWPLSVFMRMFDWGHVTFREQLEDQIYRRKYRRIASTCGHDSAIDAIRWCSKKTVKQTERTSEQLAQLPQEIVLNTKITATCGATAVVVASAPIRASAEPVPATNTVEVSSYGWATATADRPIENKGERENTQELRHVRLRTIATMKPANLELFTEVEATQLDQPDGDWFKQYYLTWKPNDGVTLSAGRLAVAPLWMTPPPFLLETVNYQRLPYSFIGYGVDADVRRGKWRLITDITGTTGLKFDDEHQFSRVEGHGRLEYRQNNVMTYAISGQASRDFARGSLDFCAHTSWTETKAAMYYAENTDSGNTTETMGGYVYAGVRPIPKLRQLELHAQADYQRTRDQTPTAPWILTGGARVLLKEGKYSLTADYQHVPGVGDAKDTGTLLLRAQVRF